MFRARQIVDGYSQRKNADANTVVGGVLAVVFPIFGFYVAIQQLRFHDEYSLLSIYLTKIKGGYPYCAWVLASN
jgi:hypothetical protein